MDKEPTFQVRGFSYNKFLHALNIHKLYSMFVPNIKKEISSVQAKNKPRLGIRYMRLILAHQSSWLGTRADLNCTAAHWDSADMSQKIQLCCTTATDSVGL